MTAAAQGEGAACDERESERPAAARGREGHDFLSRESDEAEVEFVVLLCNSHSFITRCVSSLCSWVA